MSVWDSNSSPHVPTKPFSLLTLGSNSKYPKQPVCLDPFIPQACFCLSLKSARMGKTSRTLAEATKALHLVGFSFLTCSLRLLDPQTERRHSASLAYGWRIYCPQDWAARLNNTYSLCKHIPWCTDSELHRTEAANWTTDDHWLQKSKASITSLPFWPVNVHAPEHMGDIRGTQSGHTQTPWKGHKHRAVEGNP